MSKKDSALKRRYRAKPSWNYGARKRENLFLLQQSMVNDEMCTLKIVHVRTVAMPLDTSTDFDNLENAENLSTFIVCKKLLIRFFRSQTQLFQT